MSKKPRAPGNTPLTTAMPRAPLPEDPCAPLLSQALAQAKGPVLWIVDEHIATPSRRLREGNRDVIIVSNRYDSYLEAHQAGLHALFSDMELSNLGNTCPDTTFHTVIYRISKEKALVHHIINACKQVLSDDGQLILIGGKQEGIKTYIEKASEYLGQVMSQQNGEQSTRMAVLQKQPEYADASPLDDKDYPHIRQIGEEHGLCFFSKPGQFGWDKIDQGSQYLAGHFSECFAHKAPGSVLDLGCGYGYLALQVSRFKPEKILATDNNAAALASCRYNFSRNGVDRGSVVADNCARSVQETFDTIICNPPFHQGFSTSGEMTDRFLEQTRRLLKSSGQALFVVNQFVPLEQKAAGFFRQVEIFARNKSFKLIRLAK